MRPVRALAERFVLVLACCVAGMFAFGAAAQPYDRAQVEAAYLLNFIRYTEWPAAAMPPPEAPIVVAVYRAPQTAAALEAIAASGERIAGREIEVRASRTPKRLARDIAGAHVLYVGDDAETALALARELVLTVGSVEGFNQHGGMVEVVPAGSRLVFDANVAAIRRAGLAMSAKVLALARRVEGRGS